MEAEYMERLGEIKDEIKGLLDEARGIILWCKREVGETASERARLYWLAHITTAFNKADELAKAGDEAETEDA